MSLPPQPLNCLSGNKSSPTILVHVIHKKIRRAFDGQKLGQAAQNGKKEINSAILRCFSSASEGKWCSQLPLQRFSALSPVALPTFQHAVVGRRRGLPRIAPSDAGCQKVSNVVIEHASVVCTYGSEMKNKSRYGRRRFGVQSVWCPAFRLSPTPIPHLAIKIKMHKTSNFRIPIRTAQLASLSSH